MNADDKQTAIVFIKKNFIKSEAKTCSLSSYRLKHILQYATNVYLTEQDFISLMEEQGYKKSPRGKWKMWLSDEITKFVKDRERGLT